MTVQYDESLRHAQLDEIDAVIGASPKLRMFDDVPPPNMTDPDPGTQILEMDLPPTWLNAAAGNQKTLAGLWEANAANPGTVQSYRILNNAGTTVHKQGTVSGPAGGGDIELNNAVIEAGQKVTITQYTITGNNL